MRLLTQNYFSAYLSEDLPALSSTGNRLDVFYVYLSSAPTYNEGRITVKPDGPGSPLRIFFHARSGTTLSYYRKDRSNTSELIPKGTTLKIMNNAERYNRLSRNTYDFGYVQARSDGSSNLRVKVNGGHITFANQYRSVADSVVTLLSSTTNEIAYSFDTETFVRVATIDASTYNGIWLATVVTTTTDVATNSYGDKNIVDRRPLNYWSKFSDSFFDFDAGELVIKDASIGPDQLAPGALVITPGSVTVTGLADNSVSTSKLQNSAVTDVKLASNSVTSAKIVDLSVTSSKIQDDVELRGYITLIDEDNVPPTPPAGKIVFYVRRQAGIQKLYYLDDQGVEREFGSGGGGGGSSVDVRWLTPVADVASLPTTGYAGNAIVVIAPNPTIYLHDGTDWAPLTAGGTVAYLSDPITTGGRIIFSSGTEADKIDESGISYTKLTNTLDFGTAIISGTVTDNGTREHTGDHTFSGNVDFVNGNMFRIEHFTMTGGQTEITLAYTPVSDNAVWITNTSGLTLKKGGIYNFTCVGSVITLGTGAIAGDIMSVQYIEKMLPTSSPRSWLPPVASAGALPSGTAGDAIIVKSPSPSIYLHDGGGWNVLSAGGGGPSIIPSVATTSPVTATVGGYILVTNASDTTINLPTAVGNDGGQVKVKKFSGSSSNTVTILPVSGQLIDGFTGATITNDRTMHTFTAIDGDRYIG